MLGLEQYGDRQSCQKQPKIVEVLSQEEMITYLQLWFDRLGSFLPSIPKELWLAAFLLPPVLAIFSKRTVLVLAAMLTAGVAIFVVLMPSSLMAIVATGAYAGSLLIAVFGIQLRRKESSGRAELMSLRSDLNELRNTEERRYLIELKRDRKKSEDESRED